MDAEVVVPQIALVGLLYLVVPSVVMTMMGARSPRPVTCPDNRQLAQIRLDPKREARRLFGDCRSSVRGCSRWPEMAGCDQACV